MIRINTRNNLYPILIKKQKALHRWVEQIDIGNNWWSFKVKMLFDHQINKEKQDIKKSFLNHGISELVASHKKDEKNKVIYRYIT